MNLGQRGYAAAIIVAAVGVLLVLASSSTPNASAQQNADFDIFPPDAMPYGMTYADWAVNWWQWIASVPADQSPLTDPDGRFCDVGQPDQVFFLGSNFGGTSVRSCTVSADRGILLSPGGVICVLNLDGETEEEVRACAEDAITTITNVVAEVDGVAVEGLADFQLTTPLFTFTLPEDNVLELPAGDHQAINAGFHLLLEPLSPGEHVVHMHDEFPDGFVSDVTYHLTVTAPAPATAAPTAAQLPGTGAGAGPAPAERSPRLLVAALLGAVLLTGGLAVAASRRAGTRG
jgi:hypothetical protein